MSQLRSVRWSVGEDTEAKAGDMAGQQRAYLNDAAKVSKDSTAAVARALKSAEEAREVATATLAELAAQTDSLRHVAQSLGEAEESLGHAEQTLDSINSRCWCFGPKLRLSRRASSEGAPAPPLFHDDTLAADATQQDDMLRQLDVAVGHLHSVAQTINEEVRAQQPSLEGLSGRAHDLKDRMTAANTHGKLAYIDKPKRGFWKRR